MGLLNESKNIFKNIIKKLPIFLFCVVFIGSYSNICSKQNNIVAVILLIGILLSMGSEFDLKTIYVSIFIPFLFCGIGVFAKLSLLNVYFSIPINFFSILFIMMITGADKAKTFYLPLILGYIMFQGNDVSGYFFYERVISLLIGGVIIGLIYYLRNNKKVITNSVYNLFKEELYSTEKIIKYTRLAIAITLTSFIGYSVQFKEVYWINLTILSLLNPIAEDISKRKYARVPATIIGCALFFLLFQILIPVENQMVVTLLAGFLSMFISSYFVRTIYNSFSALAITSLLVPATEAIFYRITANIIGVIVVVIVVCMSDYIIKHSRKSKERP